jgi:hypothetical protein
MHLHSSTSTLASLQQLHSPPDSLVSPSEVYHSSGQYQPGSLSPVHGYRVALLGVPANGITYDCGLGNKRNPSGSTSGISSLCVTMCHSRLRRDSQEHDDQGDKVDLSE